MDVWKDATSLLEVHFINFV